MAPNNTGGRPADGPDHRGSKLHAAPAAGSSTKGQSAPPSAPPIRVPMPSMEDIVHRNLIADAQFATLVRERVLNEQRDPGSTDWNLWRTIATEKHLVRLYDATRRTPDTHNSWRGTEMFGGIIALLLLFATLGALLAAPAPVFWGLLATTLGFGAVTVVARSQNLTAARTAARADQQWITDVRNCYHHVINSAIAALETTAPNRPTAERPAPVTITVNDIAESFDALKQAWGTYTLDREALLLTMPALRMDSVPETRAYQDAMTALEDTLDTLTPDATADQLTAAADLADHTWQTWHTACDRAREVGLDNYTPTERAALTRLATLVERLAHPSTPTYERTAITRDIERQLARITTTPVAWSDLKALPELHAALPALPPTN